MNSTDTTGLEYILFGVFFSMFFAYFAQIFRDKSRLIKNNEKIRSKLNNKGAVMMVLSCIAIWLPSALRYNVGIDNEGYLMQFNAINQFSDSFVYYEPGYGILCYLCKVCFNDYQVLLFITATLTGGLIWHSIYKYSNNLILCIIGIIAVNMYFMSYTVIRQFIAIAILTTSFQSIKERKLFRFIIINLLAIGFHYTAVVFGPLYFLYTENTKLITLRNLILLFGIVILFFNLGYVLNGVFATVASLREGYSDYEIMDTSKNIKEVIFILPILIYTLFFKKYLFNFNNQNQVFIWVLIMLILSKILGTIIPVFSRAHYYFVFGGPILLSYATRIKPLNLRFVLLVLILVYYIWSIILIFNYQWEDFLPYHIVLERL